MEQSASDFSSPGEEEKIHQNLNLTLRIEDFRTREIQSSFAVHFLFENKNSLRVTLKLLQISHPTPLAFTTKRLRPRDDPPQRVRVHLYPRPELDVHVQGVEAELTAHYFCVPFREPVVAHRDPLKRRRVEDLEEPVIHLLSRRKLVAALALDAQPHAGTWNKVNSNH